MSIESKKQTKPQPMRFDNWLEAVNYGRGLAGHAPVESTAIPVGSTTLIRDKNRRLRATVSLWDEADKYPYLTRPQA